MIGDAATPSPVAGAPGSDVLRRLRLVERIHADQATLTRLLVDERVPEVLDVDLTMRQLQCLALVAVEPGVTSHDLALRLGVRQPTVSRLLDRLIADGLVERGEDGRDRRRHPLRLSSTGAELLALTDANLGVSQRLFESVDIEMLTRIADSLSEQLALASTGIGGAPGPEDADVPADAVDTSGLSGVATRLAGANAVHVGLLQFEASLDPRDNLARITSLAEEAVSGIGSEADGVVLVAPEAAMCDFGPASFDLSAVAQRLDGPFVNGLASVAKRLRASLVVGMFERPASRSRRVYNTLVALGPDGELIASYRKIHLYDAFGYVESERLIPGPVAPVTFDVGGVRFGMMTCYDLRFPELAAALVAAGAHALLVPAAWLAGPHKIEHWSTLLRARAIETTSYVVAAGQCGSHYSGTSEVLDPMGLTVAALSGEPGTAVGVIDLARVAQVREINPTLKNRRQWAGSER
jgi:predicted amidohydrolase/DNA-binding MarR family transcriptional regulator